MSRLERLAELLSAAHEGLLEAWVWGLSLVNLMFFVIIFNEFAENGWIDDSAVEALRPIFHTMTGITLGGMALLIFSSGFSVGVWLRERDAS